MGFFERNIPRNMRQSCVYLLLVMTLGTLAVVYLTQPGPEHEFFHLTHARSGKSFRPMMCATSDLTSRTAVGKNTPLYNEILKSFNVEKFIQSLFKQNDVTCYAIDKLDVTLTSEEDDNSRACIASQPQDFKEGHTEFWDGDNQYIRHSHHSYLTVDSIVVDIGGNIGEDAQALIQKAYPSTYIILELVPKFFTNLVDKFKDNRAVFVYNFGLASGKAELNVKVEGDATSVFKNTAASQLVTKNVTLRLENGTEFFTMLGIGCFDVDLMTMNCEGGEYDILESLVSSSLIRHIRHVQFATHVTLAGLNDPVRRYCRLQELLARTHTLTYQYKFNWETWTRKDLM
jgi:FkbM family methyltransferase